MSNLSTPQSQVGGDQPAARSQTAYLLEVDEPLVVPVGKKIRILTTANDVIHAWWVPAFAVKQDAIPGFIRDTWFRADKEGIYRGNCAELCGKDHGGLFIDVTDNTEQNKKITEWTNGILNKLPLTNAVIKKSKETATTLWNTYLNEFEDRIVLSDYSSRNGSLKTTETAYLEEVKTRLGVNPQTGLIVNECSIKTLLQSEKDKNVKRLTFLVVVTNATIELEKQRVESNFNEKYAAFTTYEYVNILFPKVNFKSSVLLSMNVTDKDKQTETERVRRALAAAGRLDDAWLVERGTMPGQRLARLAEVVAADCPYFAVVLVHGQGLRPMAEAAE